MDSTGRDREPASSNDLEVLSREECFELLRNRPVGRVAVVGADGMPFVVPVNYELHDETVIFRTDTGTKLDALHRHAVAFQIDEIDPLHRTGWSVLVQGIAHEADPHELGEALTLEPWAGPKRYWIQIVARAVSGRRIRLPDTSYDPWD